MQHTKINSYISYTDSEVITSLRQVSLALQETGLTQEERRKLEENRKALDKEIDRRINESKKQGRNG